MRDARRCLTLLLACCSVNAAHAQALVLKRTPLADYLDSLGTQGLRIIYSIDLVTADQVLETEPDLSDPRSSLARIAVGEVEADAGDRILGFASSPSNPG